MKLIFLVIVFLFLNINCQSLNKCSESIQPENQEQVYTYTRLNRFRKTDLNGEKMDYVYLSVPVTNEYQEILNYYPHGGEIFEDSSSKEKYVRYTITNEMNTETGEWFEFLFEFDYIPKTSEFSTNTIQNIYPYDTTSSIYRMYTTDYFDYIVKGNDYIKQASDRIWNNSADIYDYARKCLRHVNNNFSYIVSTGFYSLDYILKQGGGDCGNLATILINLLRCKKIPSRYVSTIGHTWVEFYMQEYGWIPVDPTFNLFGKASSGYSNRIIWSNSIRYNVKGYGTSFNITGLAQVYHITIPYPHKAYECDGYERKNVKTGTSDLIENKFNLKVYPNPTQNVLQIKYTDSSLKEPEYEIIDFTGKKLQQGQLSVSNIDVSGIGNGIYILNVNIDGKNQSEVFIIK